MDVRAKTMKLLGLSRAIVWQRIVLNAKGPFSAIAQYPVDYRMRNRRINIHNNYLIFVIALYFSNGEFLKSNLFLRTIRHQQKC